MWGLGICVTLGPRTKSKSGSGFEFQTYPGDRNSDAVIYSGPISDFYSDVVGTEKNKPGLSKGGDLEAKM